MLLSFSGALVFPVFAETREQSERERCYGPFFFLPFVFSLKSEIKMLVIILSRHYTQGRSVTGLCPFCYISSPILAFVLSVGLSESYETNDMGLGSIHQHQRSFESQDPMIKHLFFCQRKV